MSFLTVRQNTYVAMADELACFADGAKWRIDSHGIPRYIGDKTWVGRALNGLSIDIIVSYGSVDSIESDVVRSVEHVVELKPPMCMRVSVPRFEPRKRKHFRRRGYV